MKSPAPIIGMDFASREVASFTTHSIKIGT